MSESSYAVSIQYDDTTDSYYIQIPVEVLRETGWSVGDNLQWVDNGDDTWTLKREHGDQEDDDSRGGRSSVRIYRG